MLVAVNVFLLVLVSFREWKSVQYAEVAWDEVVSILEKNGIRLDKSILPRDADLRAMTVARDVEAEARHAEALLGPLDAAPGDSTAYRGEKGTAKFYLNGEFTAEFLPDAYPAGDPESAALQLLAAMEFQGQVVESDAGSVTVRQTWEGAPIFNCEAVITVQDGSLRAIRSGSRHLTGSPQAEPGEAPMTVATALMRFLDHIRSHGDICNGITGFTAGYILDSQSDPARLTPTWELTTDAGADSNTYYINALTGEIRSEA